MGRPISAMKAGDQFDVDSLSQVKIAMQVRNVRLRADNKCPDIFARGCKIIALERSENEKRL